MTLRKCNSCFFNSHILIKRMYKKDLTDPWTLEVGGRNFWPTKPLLKWSYQSSCSVGTPPSLYFTSGPFSFWKCEIGCHWTDRWLILERYHDRIWKLDSHTKKWDVKSKVISVWNGTTEFEVKIFDHFRDDKVIVAIWNHQFGFNIKELWKNFVSTTSKRAWKFHLFLIL